MIHAKPFFSDSALIDVMQPRVIRFWMAELDCTEAELCHAVDEAGVVVGEVRRYLQKRSDA